MSNWKIMRNAGIGYEVYQCYRTRDENKPDHSGNRDVDKEVFDTKEEAARRCRALNDELVAPCTMGGLH